MTHNKFKKVVILVSILLLPSLFYLFLHTGSNNFKKLPFYGPKLLNEESDTIYHTVPAFTFTNQSGELVTNEKYKGKIHVVDFFFTTCPTICPQMSTHMLELQNHFHDRSDFALLSHTVNPEYDSVEVLAAYAKKVHAKAEVWDFVTGGKEEIYEIAFKGYFVNALPDELAPGGFLHSQYLILVDKKGRVRGYFDGTSTSEVNDLMDAIEILYTEEYAPLKEKS